MSLTNNDLERLSKDLDLPIIGVFSKDELILEKPQVGTYHINMSDSHKAGTHWTIFKIFCDADRPQNQGSSTPSSGGVVGATPLLCNALYFDSFGVDMPKEVAKFLKPFKPITWSNRHIQNVNSEVCGWYNLLLDYALEHRQVSNNYLDDYEKFINSWSDDTTENTKLLKERFKRIKV